MEVAQDVSALEGPGGVLGLGSSFMADPVAHGSPNGDELAQEVSRGGLRGLLLVL
jgi:hypothetical protein